MSLSAFLQDACATVRRTEAEGKKALYEAGDEGAYRTLMRQKAEFLAALYERAEPLLAEEEDENLADRAGEALESFSRNAQTALKLGSVFFMSALLYPDDYREGQPNNLERLAESVAMQEARRPGL